MLLSQLLGRPVDGLSFVLAVVALGCVLAASYVGFRTLGALTLEYWVDRDAVTIVWGVTRQVVPVASIQRLLRDPALQTARAARPWHWPLPNRRRMQVAELGVVNAYATRPLDEQLLLVTPTESYGLSPDDPKAFVAALQERYALGGGRTVEPTLVRPPLWTWPLWRDRAAMFLIISGLGAVAVMFGLLCFRFPALPSDVPLHFDANGLPDRISAKSGLFALPLLALLTWVFNTSAGVWLYRRVQHEAGYLLWIGALAVAGIAGLALVNLMRW